MLGRRAEGTNYTVGDAAGWRTPPKWRIHPARSPSKLATSWVKKKIKIKKNCALGSGASFSTVLFHELFKYKLSINEIRVFSSAVFNFVTGSHDVALVTKGKTTKPATLDLRSTCTAMAQ